MAAKGRVGRSGPLARRRFGCRGALARRRLDRELDEVARLPQARGVDARIERGACRGRARHTFGRLGLGALRMRAPGLELVRGRRIVGLHARVMTALHGRSFTVGALAPRRKLSHDPHKRVYHPTLNCRCLWLVVNLVTRFSRCLMAESFTEFQFDGIVGPTHNYGGLSPGNLASKTYGGTVSNPRAAARQGLAKMRRVRDLGAAQAVLPPQARPSLRTLRELGFH